uniref:Uncharacterized protein n=1 Tax=Arundo donax TaxID=35708 RepID=A0A0A9FNR3_ARUDO
MKSSSFNVCSPNKAFTERLSN